MNLLQEETRAIVSQLMCHGAGGKLPKLESYVSPYSTPKCHKVHYCNSSRNHSHQKNPQYHTAVCLLLRHTFNLLQGRSGQSLPTQEFISFQFEVLLQSWLFVLPFGLFTLNHQGRLVNSLLQQCTVYIFETFFQYCTLQMFTGQHRVFAGFPCNIARKSYNFHGVSPQSVNITGFIHNIHRVSL